jgi:hypothetical protein
MNTYRPSILLCFLRRHVYTGTDVDAWTAVWPYDCTVWSDKHFSYLCNGQITQFLFVNNRVEKVNEKSQIVKHLLSDLLLL